MKVEDLILFTYEYNSDEISKGYVFDNGIGRRFASGALGSSIRTSIRARAERG